MIKYNETKTLEEFGYIPNSLKPGSSKKVYLFCYTCNSELLRRRADLSDEHMCKACKFAQVRQSVDVEKLNQLRKKAVLAKYGVDNVAQIPGVNEKRKMTCLEKYGVEHHLQNKEILQKQIASNIISFGAEHFFGTVEGKKAVIEGYRREHGVNNPMHSTEIKKKLEEANIARFGVKNVFELPEVQDKARQLKLEKYGKLSPVNLGKTENKIKDTLSELFGITLVKDLTVLDGLEIDMYCNDLKVGIEYCGLYWHCEKFAKARTKHSSKYKKAQLKGVRLFTIYENEWLFRQPQVISYLRSALGKNKRKLYARNCEVREVAAELAKEFFETYHIQGKNNLGKYFAGLYKEGELLAAMSFGRHHRKSEELTLDRLCFKNDVSIVGGASKLFKFLLTLSKATTITSWSDNRWSLGKVYSALGFSKDADLPEDYSYVDTKRHIVLSKQSQKKSKTKCPPDKTEKEWCAERGFYRIWDCGKIRWKYQK
jgi:hypothetical protein